MTGHWHMADVTDPSRLNWHYGPQEPNQEVRRKTCQEEDVSGGRGVRNRFRAITDDDNSRRRSCRMSHGATPLTPALSPRERGTNCALAAIPSRAYSGVTVTSSSQTASICSPVIVCRSSAKPIKSDKSQRRLIDRATPCVRSCRAASAPARRSAASSPPHGDDG